MRKFTLSLLTLVMIASLGIGVIYAQDGGDEEETDCENMLSVITDTLGMTTEELTTALQDGQTLSEIAEAQGVSVADLALAIGNYQLDCGRILGGNRPNAPFGGRGDRGGQFGGNGPFGGDRGRGDFVPFDDHRDGRGRDHFGLNDRPLIQAISDATGLSAEEIFTMLREDDMTLAQIITENGGDVDAIIADLVEQFETNLTDHINGVTPDDTSADSSEAATDDTDSAPETESAE